MSTATRPPSLPLFGLRKGGVATTALVFQLLTQEYPQTISKLQTGLRSRYRVKISYQAVRKSVRSLESAGALSRTEAGYAISVDWLLEIRSGIDSVLSRYRTGRAGLSPGLDWQRFSASTLYEADTVWGDLLTTLCRNVPAPSRVEILSINHLPWWLPLNTGREAEIFEKLEHSGFRTTFLFSCAAAPFRMAKEFYEPLGCTVRRLKAPPPQRTHYYNIVGDTVIEVVLTPEMAERIEQLFSPRRRRVSHTIFLSLAREHTEIQITVQRNVAFAEALRSRSK